MTFFVQRLTTSAVGRTLGHEFSPYIDKQNRENQTAALLFGAIEKNAGTAMQIDCKVFATQLAWGIVTNGIF